MQDKAMMESWGLSGMRSFEQVNVARKEGERLVPENQGSASTASLDTAQAWKDIGITWTDLLDIFFPGSYYIWERSVRILHAIANKMYV